MKNYILGSHNSWSYLKLRHWWLRPFAFMAKCQSVDIKTQYEKYGVRCFDLRILINKKGIIQVAHGFMVYDIDLDQLIQDLDYLNSKGDCYVRVLNEARRKSMYTDFTVSKFRMFCDNLTTYYQHIHFWCGKNLYNWHVDYSFGSEPSCEEKYASVCVPKIIDDWWPWLFAKLHNHSIREKGTDSTVLLIDFVNIE